MKRLFILRHGKSSWAIAGLTDHQRALNNRGIRQMEALSSWWSASGNHADQILVSDAARTQETYQRLQSALKTPATVVSALYNAPMQTYLDELYGSQSDSVMIIGHNPTCDELTRYLTAPSSPAASDLMAAHFATGTLAILDCDIENWSELSAASCQLQAFLTPKSLAEAQ